MANTITVPEDLYQSFQTLQAAVEKSIAKGGIHDGRFTLAATREIQELCQKCTTAMNKKP